MMDFNQVFSLVFCILLVLSVFSVDSMLLFYSHEESQKPHFHLVPFTAPEALPVPSSPVSKAHPQLSLPAPSSPVPVAHLPSPAENSWNSSPAPSSPVPVDHPPIPTKNSLNFSPAPSPVAEAHSPSPVANSWNSSPAPSAPVPVAHPSSPAENSWNSSPAPSSPVPVAHPPSSEENSLNSSPAPSSPVAEAHPPSPAENSSNSPRAPSSPVPVAHHSPSPAESSLNSSPAASSPVPVENAPNSAPIFNVLSYRAIGDGVADDTQAFKMAWNDSCHADSGILLVPRRFTFMIQSIIFTGPCKSGIVFQIEGTLVPPDGPNSWPINYSKKQWLVFYRINGMSMQGGGMIDGRGQKWWDLPCKPHKGVNGTTLPGPCDSPVAVRFITCFNLTVQGTRVTNSPQFHFRFDGCSNVQIYSLYIKSPSLSPNTDGIHLENTNDVKIYNSIVHSGDDCVSIGAGCHNVDIRNITCGPSHGISIGSLGNHNSKACVSNITVTDSVIKHSYNGARIKTWQGGFGSVSQVAFSNIVMDTVRNPIIIDQYYCDTKGCKNQSSAVYISDVHYSNIKGTYDVRSPPVRLACSDAAPCTNLTISEVELYPSQGQKILDPYCWKAYGAMETLTIPPVFCLLEGFPDSLPPNDGLNQC